MKWSLVVLVLMQLGYVTLGEKARYDNYRLYKLNVDNLRQLALLQEMEKYPDGYRFYDPPVKTGATVSLMVPPHKFAEFAEATEMLAIRKELLVANIQQQIDEEELRMLRRPRAALSWEIYHTLDEIYAWLDTLVEEYPTLLTPIVGGSSYEGRQIRGVKLSYPNSPNKPGVFLEANIHAREWITSATATYFLNQFLTSEDPAIMEIAQNYEWYIFPVVNPDGFVYSHTTDRQWRKTRSQHSILCRGADPNRNWGFNFMQGGATNIPCTDTYAGPYAFSEIETKSLSDYFASIKVSGNITTYISFHSYQQLLLLPYGHTTTPMGEYENLMAIGRKTIDKLAERHGTQYRVGNIAEAIYIASGGSIDWIAGDQDVKVVYCYELRDQGRYAFVLPPDQIIPTGEETLDSVITMLAEAKALGYH